MIETLTDNHAILLLYLAGELPESDRRDVEKRLAADPHLAGQLAELDGIHQRIGTCIAALDEIDGSRLSADSAIDAAVSSMQSWRFGPRLVQHPKAPASRRVWAWVAPVSLAASILIAAIFWVDRHPAGAPTQIASTQPTTSDVVPVVNDADSNLALLQQSFATGFEQTPRRIAGESRPEVARDDLSDYLLKTEVGQQ